MAAICLNCESEGFISKIFIPQKRKWAVEILPHGPFLSAYIHKKTVKPLMKRATVCFVLFILLLVLNPVGTPRLYQVAPPPVS
jgi:hypothetical protein